MTFLNRRRGLLAAATGAALFLSACGSAAEPADTGADSSSGAVISTAKPGTISTDWVKWDAGSCSLVAAEAPAGGTWEAALREKSGLRLGYGTQNEGIAVVDLANASMKDTTAKVKGEYLFANYTYPDAAKVLDGARSIATRKAQVVASWNLIAPSMDAVMAIFKQACIPVIQISSKAEGAVLFGPNNAEVGTKEGEGLVEWAKGKGWTDSGLTVLGVTVPTLGESVNTRVSSCSEAVRKAFPGATTSSLELPGSTTAEGQTKMTDWLTANPAANRVIACTNADTAAFGIANAGRTANRVDQLGVGGVGGSANPGGSFVGSVDFGFKNYGSFLVPLAIDLVEGKPVPSTVSPSLTFSTGS